MKEKTRDNIYAGFFFLAIILFVVAVAIEAFYILPKKTTQVNSKNSYQDGDVDKSIGIQYIIKCNTSSLKGTNRSRIKETDEV